MLYSKIASIAVYVLLFLYPFFIIFSLKLGAELYKKGFCTGFEAKNGKNGAIEKRKIKARKKTKEEIEQEKKLNKILQNIDVYDGTPYGQEDINE